jgi:hypothetical protein
MHIKIPSFNSRLSSQLHQSQKMTRQYKTG